MGVVPKNPTKTWRDPFVAYLWGIETGTPFRSSAGRPLFVAYLWGIETKLC